MKHWKAWLVFPDGETRIKFAKAADVIEAREAFLSLYPTSKVSLIVEFDPTGW